MTPIDDASDKPKPRANGLLWAPVMHKMAHYKEVCTQWTLEDLCDAHDIIDEKNRAEQRMITEARNRHG